MPRTVVVTIDESGDQVFLKGHGADVFSEAGESIVRRASHVVPVSLPLRLAFKALRTIALDTSLAAAWTRTWRCEWQVELVGGPTVRARWFNRQRAIDFEIEYLNKFFLEGK